MTTLWSFPQHQSRKSVVTRLTGRPSTKRSSLSCQPPRGAAGRPAGRSRPEPWARHRPWRPSAHQPQRSSRPRLQGWAEPSGSTRPRPGSPPPSRDGGPPRGSGGHASFFGAYCGSGLVIQRFARRQPTPSRPSASRMVSSLTRSAVIPCSKRPRRPGPTSKLVGLPNVRGLWCKSARRRSARPRRRRGWCGAGSSLASGRPPARRAQTPAAHYARTDRCSPPSQRSVAPTRPAHSPARFGSVGARTHRSTAVRFPAALAPPSVNARTKMGGLIPTRLHDLDLPRRPTFNQRGVCPAWREQAR